MKSQLNQTDKKKLIYNSKMAPVMKFEEKTMYGLTIISSMFNDI